MKFKFKIAGSCFRKGGETAIWRSERGTQLFLEREPENQFDPHAVKVLIDSKHVGYVPRTQSRMVSDAIGGGATATCRLTDPRELEAELCISRA